MTIIVITVTTEMLYLVIKLHKDPDFVMCDIYMKIINIYIKQLDTYIIKKMKNFRI